MHDRIVRATIASGIVEGFTRDGVHRWRSIPYARPPIGPLRYRAPLPAAPWRGVRYCHSFAYCAPQQRMYTATGIGKYQPTSEDCLTLNVVAPEHPGAGPLPVMFFIHGGGYSWAVRRLRSTTVPRWPAAGASTFRSNYRLGALGCMDLSSLSHTRPNPSIPTCSCATW